MLVRSAILLAGYAYIAARLTSTATVRIALAAPFAMVRVLAVVYWFGDRDRRGRVHDWVQQSALSVWDGSAFSSC